MDTEPQESSLASTRLVTYFFFSTLVRAQVRDLGSRTEKESKRSSVEVSEIE